MGALKDEIAELIGLQGLAAMAQARGGRRAYIPHGIRAGHWIERAIGRTRAEALALAYGGSRINIPSGPSPEIRHRRIGELRRQGLSIMEIAAATGLSERWVYRVLSR